MAATYTQLPNYIRVSSLIEMLKEKGVDPADAYIVMDAHKDHNSWGETYISKELNLVVELKTKE